MPGTVPRIHSACRRVGRRQLLQLRLPRAHLGTGDLAARNQGLAFAFAKTPSGGERKLRIDGLTYGGFKPEHGEPAEQLMRALRENFTGEVIEYVTEPESAAPGAGASPAA